MCEEREEAAALLKLQHSGKPLSGPSRTSSARRSARHTCRGRGPHSACLHAAWLACIARVFDLDGRIGVDAVSDFADSRRSAVSRYWLRGAPACLCAELVGPPDDPLRRLRGGSLDDIEAAYRRVPCASPSNTLHRVTVVCVCVADPISGEPFFFTLSGLNFGLGLRRVHAVPITAFLRRILYQRPGVLGGVGPTVPVASHTRCWAGERGRRSAVRCHS
mmetsp:Transcript_34929/g.111167  ORF Transcript_34929/g.111167 Transcript_34929/m.111167 type:complete len:219 (+) Transcript_34929:645-1301(+)